MEDTNASRQTIWRFRRGESIGSLYLKLLRAYFTDGYGKDVFSQKTTNTVAEQPISYPAPKHPANQQLLQELRNTAGILESPNQSATAKIACFHSLLTYLSQEEDNIIQGLQEEGK